MNWNDISIKKFYQLCKELNSIDDENKPYRILALIKDMTLEEVLSAPIRDVEKMLRDIQFIYTSPKARMACRKYTINGRVYLPTYDMTNISTAQYIDFQAKAPSSRDNLPDFLSVLMIPEGHKYNDGYNMQEVIRDMECLGVEDAYGLSAFFLTLFRLSIKLAVRKLRRMLKKSEMTQKQKESVEKAISAVMSLDGLSA